MEREEVVLDRVLADAIRSDRIDRVIFGNERLLWFSVTCPGACDINEPLRPMGKRSFH